MKLKLQQFVTSKSEFQNVRQTWEQIGDQSDLEKYIGHALVRVKALFSGLSTSVQSGRGNRKSSAGPVILTKKRPNVQGQFGLCAGFDTKVRIYF